jgi:hypothetical protein
MSCSIVLIFQVEKYCKRFFFQPWKCPEMCSAMKEEIYRYLKCKNGVKIHSEVNGKPDKCSSVLVVAFLSNLLIQMGIFIIVNVILSENLPSKVSLCIAV